MNKTITYWDNIDDITYEIVWNIKSDAIELSLEDSTLDNSIYLTSAQTKGVYDALKKVYSGEDVG